MTESDIFSPESIDWRLLPSILFAEGKKLDGIPGIYFVIDASDNLLSKGHSGDIGFRWRWYLVGFGLYQAAAKIAWLEVREDSQRRRLYQLLQQQPS